jgi:gliding motility-associated-like protein
MPAGFNPYSGGFVVGDIHKDMEGNLYLCATTDGILGVDPKLMLCKVSANGVPIWVKKYNLNGGGYVNSVSMTSTATSLLFVIEGGSQGSISGGVDKMSGQLLNVFRYANSGGGSLYTRLLEYNQGHVFYAGNTGNSRYVMGKFDTTGRPLQLKSISEGDTYRSGYVKNGKMYCSFSNPTFNADVLLIADTGLAVLTANRFDNMRFSSSMVVNDAGNIYSTGFYGHGASNNYWDSFLRKYSPGGSLGLCPSIAITPTITNLVLNVTPLTFTDLPLGPMLPQAPFAMEILPDMFGDGIAAILCSTPPGCNALDLTGPAAVCRLNVDYTYRYTRNPGCNVRPQISTTPGLVQVQQVTDTSIVVRFLGTGTAWIKAVINTGCNAYSDSVEVQIQTGASFSLGADTLLCPGDTLHLDAGNGFSTYAWQDGSTNATYAVSRGGTYYVTVTNSCGESLGDTIRVTAGVVPPLFIGNDSTLCKADTLLINATPGFSSYQWSPAANIIGTGAQVRIVANNNQQVWVYAVTGDGCKARDTLVLSTKQARPINLGRDSSFCAGDSVVVSGGTGYAQYQWNTGSIAPSIVVKTAGSYSLTATDTNGCTARDTMAVPVVFALPRVNLGPDFNVCANEDKQLDAGIFTSYLWQDNSTARYYRARSVGTYYVTVTDGNRCIAKDSVLLKNIFPLPANFISGADSICAYEKITINSVGNLRDFLWSDGSILPTLTVTTPGRYILTAKDNNNCTGKDTLDIAGKDCMLGVYIPTAFTPNADTKNDVFRALVFGPVLDFQLQVYNRYGQLVFSSSNPLTGWDGRFKGLPQETGAFIWQCRYALAGKKAVLEKGTVLLIR